MAPSGPDDVGTATDGEPRPASITDSDDQLVSALRAELRDVLAAVNWVAECSEVDSQRIVMLGSSFGGVLTVLALGENTQLRAGVSFAGPSMTWPDAPALQQVMLAAMDCVRRRGSQPRS
jgi:dienelactone hydrolase